MPNLVETALIEYIQERQDKQGILLTPEGGYYLYGGQFCPIQAFDLSLAADGLCLQGASSVPLDLFFGLAGGVLRWCVKKDSDISIERLSLIFHIFFEDGADLLRGILFVQNGDTHSILFTNPETERLYRAVSAPASRAGSQESDRTAELQSLAAECGQEGLHILTELYLHGHRLGHKGAPPLERGDSG